MQYSWQFLYSSTLINLGRDNMFSLVSLTVPRFCFIFFNMWFFFVFAACFFFFFSPTCVGITKAWQLLLLVSRHLTHPCLENMLLSNNRISTVVLQEGLCEVAGGLSPNSQYSY